MTLRYFLAHTYKRLTRKHLHRAQLRRSQRQLIMAQWELEDTQKALEEERKSCDRLSKNLKELLDAMNLLDATKKAATITPTPAMERLMADNKHLRDALNQMQHAHGILLKDFSDAVNRFHAAKAENTRLRSTLDDYYRNYHGKVPSLERQLRGLNLDMRRLTEQHVSLQQREKALADQLAHDQRNATALSVINRMLKRKLAQLRALKPKPSPKKRRKR